MSKIIDFKFKNTIVDSVLINTDTKINTEKHFFKEDFFIDEHYNIPVIPGAKFDGYPIKSYRKYAEFTNGEEVPNEIEVAVFFKIPGLEYDVSFDSSSDPNFIYWNNEDEGFYETLDELVNGEFDRLGIAPIKDDVESNFELKMEVKFSNYSKYTMDFNTNEFTSTQYDKSNEPIEVTRYFNFDYNTNNTVLVAARLSLCANWNGLHSGEIEEIKTQNDVSLSQFLDECISFTIDKRFEFFDHIFETNPSAAIDSINDPTSFGQVDLASSYIDLVDKDMSIEKRKTYKNEIIDSFKNYELEEKFAATKAIVLEMQNVYNNFYNYYNTQVIESENNNSSKEDIILYDVINILPSSISEELKEKIINEVKEDLKEDETISEVAAIDFSDDGQEYSIYYREENWSLER